MVVRAPVGVRQVVVLVSGIVALLGLLAGTGVFGGTPIGEVGDGDLGPAAALVVPAAAAFGIWTPIYAGLVALAVWQAFPSRRASARVAAVAWPLSVSMLANAAWIVAAQAERIWLTVALIVLILVSLAVVYARLLATRPADRWEGVLLDGTVGLYLGWICVATVANVATTLVTAGYPDLWPGRTAWAVLLLAAAAAVGCAVTWLGRGRLAFPLAVAWALAWVVVARTTDGPPSGSAAGTAATGAVLVAGVAAASLLRRRPRGAGVSS
jgi:hypothetical protein